jgi:hypothetical protein
MARFMTLGEAETKRQKAVEFLRRIGHIADSDRYDAMDAAEYAASKGALVMNPNTNLRGTDMTKSELAGVVDQLADGIEEALDPELTREEVVSKLKDLADIATGDNGGEDDEDDDDG